MQAKIILNCLPPTNIQMPSPALNILKSFLNQNHFSAEIIYWNLKLENFLTEWVNLFISENYEIGRILPFIYSIAKQYDDFDAQKKIIDLLQKTNKENSAKNKPHNSKFFSNLPDKTHKILCNYIENEFKAIDFSEVILMGFTSKFYQWLPALQIAQLTKKQHPELRTVIGGFDSKESAIEMMRVFDCFDFAVWGEGEFPLVELATTLIENKKNFTDISGLVFRENGQIMKSENRKRSFIDLDKYPKPDYDDFFSEAIEDKNKGHLLFYPVESIRGCYWNRCKFCVLANGYKYRERNIDTVVDEIKIALKKYQCGFYQFLDNNVIGSELSRFNELLDKLTPLFIHNENDFCFFAEIIPYGLNSADYKKMALAGFRMLQIGGESFSDSLLKKMNKKNSFSDNLLAYKFCIKYGIQSVGANIITGIPGETTKEINECIDNIPFLRFYVGPQLMKFEESLFALEKLSRFYRELNAKEYNLYKGQFIYNLLPSAVTRNIKRFELFSFNKHNSKYRKLWEKFFKISDIYYNSTYYYKIFQHENLIVYEEYNNKVKIASLLFDDPIQWDILVISNENLVSFSEMHEKLQKKHLNLNGSGLKSMLNELKSKKIIYFNENYDKIISIIDTDFIL